VKHPLADEAAYLRRSLRRHGLSEADTDDLVQEVFVVMCRRWADYDRGRPLRPWLAGIAVRVAHDFRKRGGRELPGGMLDPIDERPGAEERLSAQRARRELLGALSVLTEHQRRLIVMADLDGLSIREVAETLSLRRFTAYTQLRRARLALARALRRPDAMRAGPAVAAPALAQPP
jgi:RNA polymerase sigma factor (sigma-70 family)